MGEYQTKESPTRITWVYLQNNKPWETWFFQRGKDELFTGGRVSFCWVPMRDDIGWRWVSWCWVPKRDDAEKEKNDYKADEGNSFHSLLNTYKDSYKLLIISWVSCIDEFFIKLLISSKKKKKKEKKNKGLTPLIS